MDAISQHYVYRQDVLDFLTVAVQVAAFLERFAQEDKKEAVNQLTCLLPMLYLKARMLDKPQPELDGFVETFCTEEAYNIVRQGIANALADDDAYIELPVEDGRYQDIPITLFISEQLADIYQELTDLAGNCQMQDTAAMNDAILACLEALDQHWGEKLLSALKALDILRRDTHFNEED